MVNNELALGGKGRPAFIPRDVFRSYMTPSGMNRYARIDGMLVSSYVARCAKKERPLPSRRMRGANAGYRLLDVVARARADALRIEAPLEGAEPVQTAADRRRSHALDKERGAIASACISLTNATILSEEEIIAGAMLLPPVMCGVYFLIRSNEVVYVGQSKDVIQRVRAHIGVKAFDRFSFIPCQFSELDLLESLYIHSMKPQLNGRFGAAEIPCAPLSLRAILKLQAASSQAHELGLQK